NSVNDAAHDSASLRKLNRNSNSLLSTRASAKISSSMSFVSFTSMRPSSSRARRDSFFQSAMRVPSKIENHWPGAGLTLRTSAGRVVIVRLSITQAVRDRKGGGCLPSDAAMRSLSHNHLTRPTWPPLPPLCLGEGEQPLVPKLCLGTHGLEALLRVRALERGSPVCFFLVATKQSFGAWRSQAELGNENLRLPLSSSGEGVERMAQREPPHGQAHVRLSDDKDRQHRRGSPRDRCARSIPLA